MKLSNMCYIIKFYINFMYKTHINIPVENQNWVSRSTSVRAHKLKQYIFLGVHVQPEQKTSHLNCHDLLTVKSLPSPQFNISCNNSSSWFMVSMSTGVASLICKFYNAVMSWNNNCDKFWPLCLRVKIIFLFIMELDVRT